MFRVSRLPALVIPESSLTRRIAHRHQTLTAHYCEHLLQLTLELLNSAHELFQMQMTFVVDHLGFVENAAHVALQVFVVMNFTIAELNDGLWEFKMFCQISI